MSFFAFNKSSGQTSPTSDQSVSFNNAKVYFLNEIGEDAHLYIGKEYEGYEKQIKGFPFFASLEMQSSDIYYDGTLYRNIPLLFDIVRQEIVINRYKQSVQIKLLNEKVKYFTLGGHRFENISLSSGNGELTNNVIYDIVSHGITSVLVKRIKHMEKGFKAEDPTSFIEKDEFYIRNGKSLAAITNKKSIMEVFDDKKALVKAFIRENRFRFKKNIERELIITADYYSTLKK